MKKCKDSIVCLMLALGLGALSQNVTALPGENFLEFTDDGGWCWFADPRAVYWDGKTYTGPEMHSRVTARAGDFSEWRPERVLDLHQGLPETPSMITTTLMIHASASEP